MANPYAPPTTALKTDNETRFGPKFVSVVNFPLAILAGGCIAICCFLATNESPSNLFALVAFFASIAAVFGAGGSYLVYRYMSRRAPLWFVFVGVGVFGVVLPLAEYPNATSALNWIAVLAIVCAVIATSLGYVFSRPHDPTIPKQER